MFKKVIFASILAVFVNFNVYAQPTHFASSKKGMVVSEQQIASEIGADILKQGGNAIDAAVAVGYALAVVDSCCGNIGGGGFMTLHLANGNNIFVNFREKAPEKARKDMYLITEMKEASVKGYLAVGVPGTVLGLDNTLQKYGRLSRKKVMAPAIRLAKEGFIVTPYEAERFAKYAADFREQPNVAAIFMKNDKPLAAGDRLVQTNLAHTLTLIADNGPDVFYRGSIAKTIVEESKKHGGILTLNDFAHYKVQFTTPLQCEYQGYMLLSAPPPSSGGVTLCEMLNILEHFPLKQNGAYSAKSVSTIVEAMRYGFTDRNNKLGDPLFVKNPVEELISKKYAAKISQKIQQQKMLPKNTGANIHKELTDTTHYSVIDDQGNAVSVTYTLNGFFGAEIMAGDTGFFLNNDMDDFATQPGKPNKFGLVQNEINAVEAGKQPLSSMSPSIILKNGNVFLVLGSPGGPRIITSVLLTTLNVLTYGMDLENAINAGRFHYQVDPDSIDIEPAALTPETIDALKKMGYIVTEQQTWSAVAAILNKNQEFYGVMDKRRPDGAAIGVN